MWRRDIDRHQFVARDLLFGMIYVDGAPEFAAVIRWPGSGKYAGVVKDHSG
jgi:hypothetical protein